MYLTEKDEQILAVMQQSNKFPTPEFQRVGGGVVCKECGYPYYDHPRHIPWHFLTVLCNGDIVKL